MDEHFEHQRRVVARASLGPNATLVTRANALSEWTNAESYSKRAIPPPRGAARYYRWAPTFREQRATRYLHVDCDQHMRNLSNYHVR